MKTSLSLIMVAATLLASSSVINAQNLLTNGDFNGVGSSGSPASVHHWSASSHDILTTTPSMYAPSQVLFGISSEHSTTNFADMDSGGVAGWLEQTFTLSGLSEVTASGYFVSYPDTATIAVKGLLESNSIAILDMANNVLASSSLTNSGFGVWEQALLTTTLGAGTYKYRVNLADSSGNDTNVLTAAPIPEPSGALLMVAGSLILLRRKRGV